MEYLVDSIKSFLIQCNFFLSDQYLMKIWKYKNIVIYLLHTLLKGNMWAQKWHIYNLVMPFPQSSFPNLTAALLQKVNNNYE